MPTTGDHTPDRSTDQPGRAGGLGHAVVLGGSLAGLCAARALADHMDRVTLVERDRFPDQPEWRRGVPQSRHTHNLLGAGQRALETLFPGLRDDLLGEGMIEVRMPQDMLLLTAGGWMRRFDNPNRLHSSISGSRDLLDAVVRRRLAAEPHVEFREQTEVVGLLAEAGSVTGVRLRTRDSDAETGWGEPHDLAADLVVDATGRTSRTPEWLGPLGYETPEETVVDARTAYVTCVFTPPSGHVADWRCMLLQSTPEVPRSGILNPIENGRWMVSLANLGGELPPGDHRGFVEFARTLRSPALHEAIRNAEPLTPVYRSGRTENRRRHYERLARWPDRFLVVGDGAGSFNPSYGQGISVAASTAVALGEALRGHVARGNTGCAGVAGPMRATVAKCVDAAWLLAANADLAYPGAADRRPPLPDRLAGRYMNRLLAVASESRPAAVALLDMTHMLTPPQAAFRPRVMAAVLRGRRGSMATPPARLGSTEGARGTVADRLP